MWTKDEQYDGEWSYRETVDGVTYAGNLGRSGDPGTMWRANLYVNGDMVWYSKGGFQYLRSAVNREVKRIKQERDDRK